VFFWKSSAVLTNIFNKNTIHLSVIQKRRHFDDRVRVYRAGGKIFASTATTEKYYAKFINDDRIKRGEFLEKYGFVSQDVTNVSQDINTKILRKEA